MKEWKRFYRVIHAVVAHPWHDFVAMFGFCSLPSTLGVPHYGGTGASDEFWIRVDAGNGI